MRINLRKSLSLLIVSVLFITSFYVFVPARTVLAANGVYSKLMSLQTKFPDGKYWNHVVPASEAGRDCTNEAYANNVTSTPCKAHRSAVGASAGDYDCNYFDGGIQCCGFAKKVFYDVFGERESSNSLVRHYTSDGLQVGDYVCINGGGHYAVVLSVSSSTFTVVECNLDQIGPSYNCKIRWNYSYNKSQIQYYVHSNNYDKINNSTTHTHEYNDISVITAPTATSTGTWRFKCSCGATKTQTIPALNDANIKDGVYKIASKADTSMYGKR